MRSISGVMAQRSVEHAPDTVSDKDRNSERGGCFVRAVQGVTDYFAHLPGVDNPEIFGMHENANVTFNTNESLGLMQTVSAPTPMKRERTHDKPPFKKKDEHTYNCWFPPYTFILDVPGTTFLCTLSTLFFVAIS